MSATYAPIALGHYPPPNLSTIPDRRTRVSECVRHRTNLARSVPPDRVGCKRSRPDDRRAIVVATDPSPLPAFPMRAPSRFFVAAIALAFVSFTPAATQSQLPRVTDFTRGMVRGDGFIPFYYSEPNARLYFELSRFDQDFLYLRSLATGVGIPAAGV